jgi:hypothetical protein
VENPVDNAVEKTAPPVDNFFHREFSTISTGQNFNSLWKCGKKMFNYRNSLTKHRFKHPLPVEIFFR